MKTFLLVFFIFFFTKLKADVSYKGIKWRTGITALSEDTKEDYFSYPEECAELLEAFAQCASNLSLCSIRHSRPIRLCEKCINEYVKFYETYQNLLTKVVNGTSCASIFMSQDRLNVVKDYHDNIAAVWNNGNCNTCYDWNGLSPTLKNDTKTFNKMYNDTIICILNNNIPDNPNDVCEKCFESYVQLDLFYKTLSTDGIGVDSVCMDIVDSMNATRSIWSKELNCCNLRRTPEIAFLCCASIVSILPLIYYVVVRFCTPIRDLPNVLKQTRFKHQLNKREKENQRNNLRDVNAINE